MAREKESLKLRAYNIIKEKIIACEYAPSMLLSEEVLREELNVSRTPIRDALSRLEQEGLIKILPKKGIIVSGLSISDINMIYEVRMLYEPHALRRYGELIDNETIIQFINDFSPSTGVFNAETCFHLDDAFHAAIVGAIPNHYLQYTYNCISNQNRRLRVMSGRINATRLEETPVEHLRILKACLKRDWEEAAREMAIHLQQSKNATFDMLLNNGDTTL